VANLRDRLLADLAAHHRRQPLSDGVPREELRGRLFGRASPGVQRPEEIERDLEARLEALHRVADRIYDRWCEGLARG